MMHREGKEEKEQRPMCVHVKLPFRGTSMPGMSIINLVSNISKKDMVLDGAYLSCVHIGV